MPTIDDLYSALQNFRSYVENNMPFKQTVNFGNLNPIDPPGFFANLGSFYIKLDDSSSNVDTIYYKKTPNSTGWVEIGTGSGGGTSAIVAAGLTVMQMGSNPYSLNLELINLDGSIIDLSSPLTLPFRNSVDTNEDGYLDIITIVNPINLLIPDTESIGFVSGVASKLYVYVGVNVLDVDDIILAVKKGNVLDTSLIHTVYDFESEPYTEEHVYSELSVASANYSLRLVSVVDVTYSNVTGWGSPVRVSSTLGEENISDRLLSVTNDTVGTPLRQQINDLTKPNISLKDFQKLYNNLVVQTYSENNSVRILSVNNGYSVPSSELYQYYAFIYNSLDQNGVITIPITVKDKTCHISNSSLVNNLVVSYDGETITIEPQEIRHLNFCGSENPSTPKIRTLDNKKIVDSIMSVNIEYNAGTSSWIYIAKHPNGSNLSTNNPLLVNSSLTKISEIGNLDAYSRIQQIKLTSNLTISCPDNVFLGGDDLHPFRIYIYVYNNAGTLGLALSGVKKVLNSGLENIYLLNGSSNVAGRLYGSANISNVPVKCIGYAQYNDGDGFERISYILDTAIDEVISTYYATNTDLFSSLTNTDTILSGLQKLQDTNNWLRLALRQSKEIQEISVAEVIDYATPNTPNATKRVLLEVGYDVNGYATRLGDRYVIFDYLMNTTVLVNNVGCFLAVEVLNAEVTLAWTPDSAASHTLLTLRGNGRRYYIWVAAPDSFDELSTVPRFRIISEYPSSSVQNYIELEPDFNTYQSNVGDKILLGPPTQNNTINLPNPSVTVLPGEKVDIFLSSVDGVPYEFDYILQVDNTIRKFYQTTDSTVTINNGGIHVVLEFCIIDSQEYWIINYTTYDSL